MTRNISMQMRVLLVSLLILFWYKQTFSLTTSWFIFLLAHTHWESLQKYCLVVLATPDILPLHFYIATATKNRCAPSASQNTRLVQHIPSETWSCCPNWTCHSSFGFPLAATTAILTQQIGLPLGFWPIASSQIHWTLFHPVRSSRWSATWHHQVIFSL